MVDVPDGLLDLGVDFDIEDLGGEQEEGPDGHP
jgi:hypothetical protein